MQYHFYRMNTSAFTATPGAVRETNGLEEWSPSLRKLLPPDAPFYPFGIYWMFHHLRIFKNREYKIVFVREADRVIQRTCLLPAFFRFPFMPPTDLSVSTWTLGGHRGKGLATRALQGAIDRSKGPKRSIWYVTKERNLPSIRLAERLGFSLFGKGRRVSVLGFRFLGHFVLETLESPCASANASTCVESSAK
jgi:RimJ/RimL family protein N-acetyltransferase